jgi:hypothetical protein
LIQFVSPDDEYDVFETCRVINRNKYIERNLCVTLVIYQESPINKTVFAYLLLPVTCDLTETYSSFGIHYGRQENIKISLEFTH